MKIIEILAAPLFVLAVMYYYTHRDNHVVDDEPIVDPPVTPVTPVTPSDSVVTPYKYLSYKQMRTQLQELASEYPQVMQMSNSQ